MDPRKSKRISELAAKRCRPEQVVRFQNLPEEVILKILSFLDIDDVINVAQTTRLKTIVDESTAIWRKAFVDHGHKRSEVLAEMAASRKETDPKTSVDKLNFQLHKKVQRNFAGGLFQKVFIESSKPELNYSSFGNVPAIWMVTKG